MGTICLSEEEPGRRREAGAGGRATGVARPEKTVYRVLVESRLVCLTSPSLTVVSERTVVSLVTIVVSCVVRGVTLVSALSPTRAESVPPLLHAAIPATSANAVSTVLI
jgi:hypothetical protein